MYWKYPDHSIFQILSDIEWCGVYVSSLYHSQAMPRKYPVIIIISSGKTAVICHENSYYFHIFLFLADAEEALLILDEKQEELVTTVS